MGKKIENVTPLPKEVVKELNRRASEVGYTIDPVTVAIDDLSKRSGSNGRPSPDYHGDDGLE